MAYMEKVEHREEERIRPGQPHVLVEAQGHLFRMKVTGRPMPGGDAVRGTVTTFSARSRKRMLEKLARIDMERAGFVCFITLTYPDRTGPPSPTETEGDRRTFLKRLKRLHPDCSAIWRREWERRKRGAFKGVIFPHYHMLGFGLPFLPCEDLNRMWREVVEYEGYIRTEITGIESWRQAMHYAAKYMAKVEKDPRAGAAAAVTRRNDVDRRGLGAEGPGSLVNMPYLAAEKSMGRSWGVLNKSRLPLGEQKTLLLTVERGDWIDCMKGLAVAEWAGIDKIYPGCGFTLFTDDPYEWVEIAQEQQAWRVEDYDEDGNYCPVPF